MIVGIGTDIIEVARIRNAVAKEEFKVKIFSAREIIYCESQKHAENFAARYAAKEAFMKAMGTGYRDGIAFAEVEIINDELGKPDIILSGKTKELFHASGATHIHVSVSHIKETAIAYVIIERLLS